MSKGDVDPLEKEVDDFIKRFDGNKDSKLSAEELKWGVRHLLIPLSKDQRERLLQLVDENQDGEISREVLHPPFLPSSSLLIVSSPHESLSDGRIVQEIANFLRYRTNQLSDLFKEFDRDDSGFIDQSEVRCPSLCLCLGDGEASTPPGLIKMCVYNSSPPCFGPLALTLRTKR